MQHQVSPSEPRRSTLLLADDHPMMREGLKKLLEPDFEVIGMAATGREMIEIAERRRPDLILADISMPGLDGLEALRRLRLTLPDIRVLVLSVHTEPSWVRAAFTAGAHGYLDKSSAPEEIETAVRTVLQGQLYVSPRITRSVVLEEHREAASSISPRAAAGELLTARELDIVQRVGRGLRNKEIALELGVSVTTVRTHLNKVYDKLGSASRVELALLAARTDGVVM